MRLWERKTFTLLGDERAQTGEPPIGVLERMLNRLDRNEGVATADDPVSGDRISGYVYFDSGDIKVLDNREVERLTRPWPEMPEMIR